MTKNREKKIKITIFHFNHSIIVFTVKHIIKLQKPTDQILQELFQMNSPYRADAAGQDMCNDPFISRG